MATGTKRKVSAGCLVTREREGRIEVLLVHPRGATFRKPSFGIPKGLVDAGEDLRTAALRETFEETGLRVRITGELGAVRQKSGKLVHAFRAVVEEDSLSAIDTEGRCRSGDRENDVCRFYPIEQAEKLMIEAQREFLQRL